MCLAKVTQEYNKTQNKIHLGYKIFFKKIDGRLGFHHFFLRDQYGDTQDIVDPDKWLQATDSFPQNGLNGRIQVARNFGKPAQSYKTGFHVYRNEQDAYDMCSAFGGEVFKVKFRNVTAKGLENYFNRDLEIVVAQEIFIPKDQSNDR